MALLYGRIGLVAGLALIARFLGKSILKRSGKVSPGIVQRGNSSFSRRLGGFRPLAVSFRGGLKGVDFLALLGNLGLASLGNWAERPKMVKNGHFWGLIFSIFSKFRENFGREVGQRRGQGL